jgi:drug/metabolite transporter (DMT)-like permease
MPITLIFFREEMGWMKWVGFILSIGGLLFLLSPWELNWSDTYVLFGTAMLLLASFSWAVSMLCARYMEWNKSPLELIPWQLLIGTLPILLFALIKEPSIVVQWNTPLLLSLAYTGMLVTGISYWCAQIINKELPTLVASLGFLAAPMFSIIVSTLFLNEVISLTTAGAMGLILIGLACIVV